MIDGIKPTHEIDHADLRSTINKTIISSLPSAGFDPLTASQDELTGLGFPTRPNPEIQPAAFLAWRSMFARPIMFEAFRFDIKALAKTKRRAVIGAVPSQQDSLNWSGAYITPRDGTTFSEIWGQFQVERPNLPQGSALNAKYRCSTWIGFDGQRRYLNSTLPQIGTAQNSDPAAGGTGQTVSMFAWWQWWMRDVPGSVPVQLTAPTIHAGDLIALFMQVASDRKQVAFAISNLTTNRAVQFTQRIPSKGDAPGFKIAGATAEWVTERSADPPDPTPLQLPDYGTVNFHDCGATAVHVNTGETVERSLSAAKLIDMYALKRNPDRITKISIAKSLGRKEFITRFQS